MVVVRLGIGLGLVHRVRVRFRVRKWAARPSVRTRSALLRAPLRTAPLRAYSGHAPRCREQQRPVVWVWDRLTCGYRVRFRVRVGVRMWAA